jgi:hypothetical protein
LSPPSTAGALLTNDSLQLEFPRHFGGKLPLLATNAVGRLMMTIMGGHR